MFPEKKAKRFLSASQFAGHVSQVSAKSKVSCSDLTIVC